MCELGVRADGTGYGLDGRAATFAQREDFAVMIAQTCAEVASGYRSWNRRSTTSPRGHRQRRRRDCAVICAPPSAPGERLDSVLVPGTLRGVPLSECTSRLGSSPSVGDTRSGSPPTPCCASRITPIGVIVAGTNCGALMWCSLMRWPRMWPWMPPGNCCPKMRSRTVDRWHERDRSQQLPERRSPLGTSRRPRPGCGVTTDERSGLRQHPPVFRA